MFLCNDCHGENEPYNFNCDPDFPFGKSYGACENCKKTGGCLDCHVQEHTIIKHEEEKHDD